MHTDQAPKEKPTGSANYPAGHTDEPMVPNSADAIKSTVNGFEHKKQFATLHRTSPADMAVTFYAQRWGLVQHLPSLESAGRVQTQIVRISAIVDA